MENKLMVCEGYIIQSEQDVKNAVTKWMKNNPDITYDGASKKDIVKMYKKRTKPYKHIVFIKADDNWFIKFLVDEEVLHYIPMSEN
jgi:hypothetical protein